MRDLHRAALLALLAISLGACSSTTAMRVDERGFTLERPAPLTGPANLVKAVSSTDEEVTLWVRFKDVAGPHTVRIRWMDPHGRLALDSGPVVLNREGGFRPEAGITSTLPIHQAPAGLLPGRWSARIDVDGSEVAEQGFELVDAG